jgi:hypothetical protein
LSNILCACGLSATINSNSNGCCLSYHLQGSISSEISIIPDCPCFQKSVVKNYLLYSGITATTDS